MHMLHVTIGVIYLGVVALRKNFCHPARYLAHAWLAIPRVVCFIAGPRLLVGSRRGSDYVPEA
jgi:hypothetical protein